MKTPKSFSNSNNSSKSAHKRSSQFRKLRQQKLENKLKIVA